MPARHVVGGAIEMLTVGARAGLWAGLLHVMESHVSTIPKAYAQSAELSVARGLVLPTVSTLLR